MRWRHSPRTLAGEILTACLGGKHWQHIHYRRRKTCKVWYPYEEMQAFLISSLANICRNVVCFQCCKYLWFTIIYLGLKILVGQEYNIKACFTQGNTGCFLLPPSSFGVENVHFFTGKETSFLFQFWLTLYQGVIKKSLECSQVLYLRACNRIVAYS